MSRGAARFNYWAADNANQLCPHRLFLIQAKRRTSVVSTYGEEANFVEQMGSCIHSHLRALSGYLSHALTEPAMPQQPTKPSVSLGAW